MDSVDTIYHQYSARCMGAPSHLKNRFGALWLSPNKVPSKELCDRTLDLGYRALIVDTISLPSDQIECIYRLPHQGLPCCPVDPDFPIVIQEQLAALPKSLQGIVYISRIDEPTFAMRQEAEIYTYIELLVKEMKTLEQVLPKGIRLYYYLKTENPLCGQWLRHLSHNAAHMTTLLFPATFGTRPHPFWKVLETMEESIITPLMPILPLSHLSTPHLTWAAPPFDLVDRYLLPERRHAFVGGVIPIDSVPKKETLGGAHLLMALDAMIHSVRAERTFVRWAERHHKEWEIEKHLHLFTLARELVRGLEERTAEGAEVVAIRRQESSLQLKRLALYIKEATPSLKELFTTFIIEMQAFM